MNPLSVAHLRSIFISTPKFLLYFLIFSLPLTANAFTTQKVTPLKSHQVLKIIKSPNDHRQYRSITLPNQLQVLLISDPTADKEAAAMDVKVGSTSDPKDYEGLAHFLEHMLFLGTKKYPKPGAYQTFISEHGGNHNAFTAAEETNFFFDIKKGELKPALDRFSQQFIAPTFTEKYVDRERNAVNSEYSTKAKDDGRLYYSVLKQIINKNNPYHNFAIGNLTTLSDKPEGKLRDKLIAFYRTHYSANLMKLVILGREPLNTLEKWAKENFSAVPNHHLKAPVWHAPLFIKGTLPALVQYKPVMNRRSLALSFPIPSPRKLYRSKPTYYWANLIGHEGKGGLLAYLKKQGLADGLSAGEGMDTLTGATFDINIRLTQKGLAKWKKVMSDVFGYIHLLQSRPVKKLYFNESKTMLGLSFRFAEKEGNIRYVSLLASEMQRYPVSEVIAAGYTLDSFLPGLYKKYLGYLNEKNVLVSLVSPGAKTNKTTDWYQAGYSLTKWTPKNFPALPVNLSTKFHLPVKNEFIPKDTQLLKLPTVKIPYRLEETKGLTAWYMPDKQFKTPKENIFINIRSPEANNSAKHAVLTELFTFIVNDKMDEFGYPASLAGLNYQIYKNIRGISIKLGGWSDKQDALLEKILSQLKDSYFSQERFNIFKERMIRSLENMAHTKPYQQVNERLANLLVTPGWSRQEKLDALKKVTLEDLETFPKQFFNKIQVVSLITGNTTPASALGINQLISAWLQPQIHATQVSRGSVVKLPPKNRWIDKLKINHPDSGYLLYLQGQNRSFAERARYLLMTQLISSPYYENIRTEHQLGYVVYATDLSILETPALGFVVESPSSPAEKVQLSTMAFLKKFTIKLSKMKIKTFNANKSAIVSRLLQKPLQLRQVSNRLWMEIDRSQFKFNTRKRLVSEINKISKKSLLQFYRKQILPLPRALLIYSNGNQQPDFKAEPKESAAFKTFKSVTSKSIFQQQLLK